MHRANDHVERIVPPNPSSVVPTGVWDRAGHVIPRTVPNLYENSQTKRARLRNKRILSCQIYGCYCWLGMSLTHIS